jgi:hypothetical protein
MEGLMLLKHMVHIFTSIFYIIIGKLLAMPQDFNGMSITKLIASLV